MKYAIAALFALSLGIAPSYAQQRGGTCSGHAAGCNQYCQNVRNASGCQAICNNLFTTCMQTGTWEKRTGQTDTNLQRR